MSVCSERGMVSDSLSPAAESNRHSSTRDACSENSAKFTPTPSHVAPSGYGVPGQTLIDRLCTADLCISKTAADHADPQSSRGTTPITAVNRNGARLALVIAIQRRPHGTEQREFR